MDQLDIIALADILHNFLQYFHQLTVELICLFYA